MATLFGFDVRTPEEILEEQNQTFAAMKARDPNNPQIAAQQAIFNIVGSPELSLAKKTRGALASAMSSFKPAEGIDEFDRQVQEAEHIRNKMAAVNPELALQANDRVLSLRSEQLQQQRLKSGLKSEEQSQTIRGLNIEEAQDVAKKARQRIIFSVDPETGAPSPVKALSNDVTPEEAIAELEAMRQSDPEGIYQAATGLELWQLSPVFRPAALRGMGGRDGGGEWNNSTRAKYLEGIDAATGFTSSITDTVDTLLNDVLAANPLTADVTASGDSVFKAAQRVADEFFTSTEDDPGAGAAADDALSRGFSQFGNLLQSAGGNSAAVRAQITALAYQLAKTLDPGGRLSDQDVEMAIRMITGNGSPEVISDLFSKRVAASHRGIQTGLFLANQGDLGAAGNDAASRYQESLEIARQTLLDLNDEIRARNLNVRQPSPASTRGGANKPKPKLEYTVRPAGG